jgi:hypothetical protein
MKLALSTSHESLNLARYNFLMILAYLAMAIFIVFGIIAILTSILDKTGKHDWVPTKLGGIIGGIALILFLLAGVWLLIMNL